MEGQRITEDGNLRITSTGDIRITEAYERIQNAAAIIAAQTSMTATAIIVFSAAAIIAAQSAMSVIVNRVQSVISSISCVSSFTANAIGIFKAVALIAASSTFTATVNRILHNSVTIVLNCVTSVIAVFKWNDEPITPETWTEQGDNNTIWTGVTPESEDWKEIL